MPVEQPNYIFEASEKPDLPLVSVPSVLATKKSLEGFGYLVDQPDSVDIEIVRWPAQGWRPVDTDSGDEGGITEGVFHSYWQEDVLMGRNEAVNGHYVLGWSTLPQSVGKTPSTLPAKRVLLWHFNYHPDGGQLFYPMDQEPFVLPLALPGDDLRPENIVTFWCDGSHGIYIHPNIWHEGVFTSAKQQRFLDRQGKVHARVSCDFGKEFGVYLDVSLEKP